MRRLAPTVLWLALIVWIGAIVFFSFVVAPRVFATLPSATAGQVVSAIFPTYYALGAGAGLAGIVAALALRRQAGGGRRWSGVAALLALMLAATAYAGGVVHPRARDLRDAARAPAAPAETQAEFRRLHRLAVALNGGVLVLGLATVAITAAGFRLRER
jgi:hypothetical protein